MTGLTFAVLAVSVDDTDGFIKAVNGRLAASQERPSPPEQVV